MQTMNFEIVNPTRASVRKSATPKKIRVTPTTKPSTEDESKTKAVKASAKKAPAATKAPATKNVTKPSKAVTPTAKKTTKQAQAEAAKAAKLAENAKSMGAATLAMEEGDQIALKDEAYQNMYVKNANNDLYILLQLIMAFAEKVLASKHVKTIISCMRHKLKFTHRINTQSNTPELSVIVRFVTRTSRKNACVYARVIKKAMADGITSKGLVKYIEANKGIDNIRTEVKRKAAEPVELSEEERKNTATVIKLGESYLNHLAKSKRYVGTVNVDQAFRNKIFDCSGHSNLTYFACDFVNAEYQVVEVIPVDPEFEKIIYERFIGYRMGLSGHSKEEAEAMNNAAKEVGIRYKKPLYVYKS